MLGRSYSSCASVVEDVVEGGGCLCSKIECLSELRPTPRSPQVAECCLLQCLLRIKVTQTEVNAVAEYKSGDVAVVRNARGSLLPLNLSSTFSDVDKSLFSARLGMVD